MLNQEKHSMDIEHHIDVLMAERTKTGVKRRLKCKGSFRT
jgi:hypothetical protein